jgi:hypothetical protein
MNTYRSRESRCPSHAGMLTGLALQPQRLVSTTAQAAKHDGGNSVGMENTHPTPRPAVFRSLYEFRKNIKEECLRGHPIMKDQQQPSQSHWSTSGILISWIGIIGRGRSPAHAADRFRCISLSRRAIGWQVTASMWQTVVEPRAEYARQMQSTLASDDLQWQKSAICVQSALAWTCKAGFVRECAFRRDIGQRPQNKRKVVNGCMQLAEPCPTTSETRLLRLISPTYSLPLNES